MKSVIYPGCFGVTVPADSRRIEFDYQNESLINLGTAIDYVFIGDSITHFWQLEAYFNQVNQVLINRGIGGDSLPYIIKRFEADALQLKPKHIILLAGINDMWALEDDGWANTLGQSADEVNQNILQHYEELMMRCVEANQSLIVCSILPTNMTFSNKNEERNNLIVEVNESIKQLAKTYHFCFVDYYHALVSEDKRSIQDGLTKEGLHPISTGYKVMASVLKETLIHNGWTI